MEPSRRRSLAVLLGLPLIGSVLSRWEGGTAAAQSAQDVAQSPDVLRYRHNYEAVQVCRVLNTALRRHFVENHSFPSLSELAGSVAVGRWLEDPQTQTSGYRALFEMLDFTGNEMRPGWRASFQLSATADRYVIMLEDQWPNSRMAFVSDEAGVIFSGDRSSVALADNPDGAKPLVIGEAIKVQHGVELIRSSGRVGYAA